MKAEIIAVGNEIVYGHTVNTNASFIAQHLEKAGVMPSYHTVVCDDETVIREAVKTALRRTDIIILTGGLGPTKDDLTKEAVCGLLGFKMEVDDEELEKIRQYFLKKGKKMPDNNIKQAAFPKEAIVLANKNGTAPGCMMEVQKKLMVLLPGPPKEMQPMFIECVEPYLTKNKTQYMKHLDIHCFGIGEGELAEKAEAVLGSYAWGEIATYLSGDEVIIRITVQGDDKDKVEAVTMQYKKRIADCLGQYIIGYDNKKIEQSIAELLKAKGLQAATIESCTGGLLAATLVNCSGISACFKEGVVAYSNEAKTKYAGVNKQTLARVGAVSEETAREMAEGIRRVSGADIGLATTGIAGPGGGTPQKPVGLVYIGIAMPDGTSVFRLLLSGTRREIREKTVKHTLCHLYQKLCEK